MTHARLLASGILLAVTACGGDPTGPVVSVQPTAIRVAIGDTIAQVFAPGDSVALFTIKPSEQTELAVFIQGMQTSFFLTISDSLTGAGLAQGQVEPDAAPNHLTLSRSNTVSVQAGQVLLIRAQRFQTTTSGRLQLWVYRINRAPEAGASSIAVDDTLQGDVLENSADIDEYTFSAAAGDEFIAFVQGQQGVFPGGLGLRVLPPGGNQALAAGVNGSGDVELEAQPSGRFVTPAAGTYRLSVGHFDLTVATQEFPASGSYRLLLRRIDRRPEDPASAFAPGDTLSGESIDFVGDVDEFHVPVQANQIYNVFIQALATLDSADLQVTASTSAGQVGLAASRGGDSALVGQFTGDLTTSVAGTLTIRVTGASDGPGLDRGPYRLFVYPINRAPELTAASLTPGDSVTETIEFPGDIDDFSLSPPSTGNVNLILRRSNTRTEWLDLSWLQAGEGVTLNCYPRQAGPESGCGSGRISVAGPLSLTVASQLGATTPFRGEYRLVTFPIDTLPEGRPQQVAIGDMITGTLNPVGDMDVYALSYSAGDLIEIKGTGGVGTSSADSFIYLFVGPDGNEMPGYAGNVSGATGRFTLPSSGSYLIEVLGTSTGRIVTESGPYTLAIKAVGSGTETVSGPIAPGDSVSAESIDTLGDVDDYVIGAAPGTEVVAFVRGTTRLLLDAIVPGTSTLISSGANFNTGRLKVPASGQLGLRTYELRSFSSGLNQSGFGFTGPYSITVHSINRAPETLGATLTLGVTSDGEALDIEGDVDEFTFAGTTGQHVTGTVSAPFGLDRGRVVLEIVDPSNGAVLGDADSGDGTVASTGSVTLPGTRTYLVRARGLDSREGKGGYRFLIQ